MSDKDRAENVALISRLMASIEPMTKIQLKDELGISLSALYTFMRLDRNLSFKHRLKVEAYCKKKEAMRASVDDTSVDDTGVRYHE
jgi:hypothetical protein